MKGTKSRRNEQGQTMAEYAVILGVITPIIVIVFALLSGAVANRVQTVVGYFS